MSQVYERVFTARNGQKYISVLLSESLQQKINSFFSYDDSKITSIMDDIISFMDNNNIIHSDNYKREYKTLCLSFSVSDESGRYISIVQSRLSDEDLNKIKDYIAKQHYDEYIEDLNAYFIRLKASADISVINTSDYSSYPEGLQDYLDSLEKELLIVINETINTSFKEYFYPCKNVGFRIWDIDDGKVSANFSIKSKVKGAKDKLDDLSNILENEL